MNQNISREGQAFLDALAIGESGPRPDYTILYGGAHFLPTTPSRQGYYDFPLWPGQDNSHAAGRYQFEPATWKDVVERLDLGHTIKSFRNPDDQDLGAWLLAQDDFHRKGGANLLTELRGGSDDDLANVATTLKSTWTSLGPGSFPDRYRAALAALPAPVETPPLVSSSVRTVPVAKIDSLIYFVEQVLGGLKGLKT